MLTIKNHNMSSTKTNHISEEEAYRAELREQYNTYAQEPNSKQKTKWYKTPFVIVVFLVLLPPIGLFLMWKYATWSNKVKWIITVLAIIYLARDFYMPNLTKSFNTHPSSQVTTEKQQSK